MNPEPSRHLDAILDECTEALGLIEARLANIRGDETGVAERVLSALHEATIDPCCGRAATEGSRLLVLASDACPACGSPEIGTAESVPGVALCRISEGRIEWTGQTEIDWNGSETIATDDGVVLACASCGERWVHPSLALERT